MHVKHVGFFVALVVAAPALSAPDVWASEYDHLVAKHAAAHGVPEALVRRVIHIESKGNPRVVSKGNYGLMQIRLGTARAMGYGGDAQGLLNADTNMTYAVKYLAGAYRAAGGNGEQAIRNYQRGYYARAKAKGASPHTVVSTTPSTQQPAAPDPTMLQAALERRAAIERQRFEQRETAAQQRIEQQVAEQQKPDQRQAALPQKLEREANEQEQAARQRALDQQPADQRQAALQQKLEREQANEQQKIARKQADEQKKAAQRQAALQQKLEREQAREQRKLARSQASPQLRIEQPALPQQTGEPAVKPPAAPRRASAASSYSWYNPMRFFTHPAHKANPTPRVER